MVLFVIVKVFGWSKLCFKSIFIIIGMLLVWCKFVVMYLLFGFRLYSIGICVLIILKLFKDNFIFAVWVIVSRCNIVLVEFFIVIIIEIVFLMVLWVIIWWGKICLWIVFINVWVDFFVLLVFFVFFVVIVDEYIRFIFIVLKVEDIVFVVNIFL